MLQTNIKNYVYVEKYVHMNVLNSFSSWFTINCMPESNPLLYVIIIFKNIFATTTLSILILKHGVL